MPDLFDTNNNLTIMRFEHQKLIAEANIKARSIRILELEEESLRCKADIEAQKKVIEEQERQIKIHIDAENKKTEKEE
jgi:hypothetical protein